MMKWQLIGKGDEMMSNSPKAPFIEEYEINPNTMLIMPIQYGSKVYSQVWEFDDIIVSPFRPIDIIRTSCKYFGSSYEGRKEGTAQLTGITHKAPITIDPTNFIYFFPTTSASNPKCIWLSFEHIYLHRKAGAKNTEVIFKNKQQLTIPISYNSLNNQLLRTALLKNTLVSRIEDSERKSIYLINGRRNTHVAERIPYIKRSAD